MKFVHRSVTNRIVEGLKKYPVVGITGARQTGKTTLCQFLLPEYLKKEVSYFTFDDPDERLRFSRSAVTILEDIKEPVVILDEIQKNPDVFDPLKYIVDRERQKPALKRKKFIITGSSHLMLLRGIKETLAGRIILINLYPFSFSETASSLESAHFLTELLKKKKINKRETQKIDLLSSEEKRNLTKLRDNHLMWGGFPPVWNVKKIEDRIEWLKNYRKTYLERDIYDAGGVADIGNFLLAQKILCLRTGSILSYSEVAKEVQVAVNTIKRYVYILNVTFNCFLLQPFYKHAGKRLVKSPKIYFTDTGLCRSVAGEEGISKGKIYETWVFTELLKWKELQTPEPEIYYYRTASGVEVDFIIRHNKFLLPVEAKAGRVVDHRDAKHIEKFMNDYRPNAPVGLIIYSGSEIVEVRKNIYAVPDWYVFL